MWLASLRRRGPRSIVRPCARHQPPHGRGDGARRGAPTVQVSEEVLWGTRPDREIVRFAREAGSGLVAHAAAG